MMEMPRRQGRKCLIRGLIAGMEVQIIARLYSRAVQMENLAITQGLVGKGVRSG